MSTYATRDGRVLLLRPALEQDAASLIQAIDSIAREEAYFIRSRFEADEQKQRAFISRARQEGNLVLVAVDGRVVVGWLTLFRAQAEFQRHTAQLGMGVIRQYREVGLGAELMSYALRWAAKHEIEKVNLAVRASNERAVALYSRFGFAREGYRVRDIKDSQGRYDDDIEMAYFVTEQSSPVPGADGGMQHA
jgi:RimJ/RimL family protein N-acetyltransferase